MRSASIFLVYIWLVLCGLPLAAQDGASNRGNFGAFADPPQIQVEVFVSDAEGRPVRGLDADAFELFENGRRVGVADFYAMDDGVERRPARYGTESLSESKASTSKPRLVFLIDQLYLSSRHHPRLAADLREFVAASMAQGDLAMVAGYSGAVRVEQAFTSDPTRIMAAIDRLLDERLLRPDSAAFERQRILRAIEEARGVEDFVARSPEDLGIKVSKARELLQDVHGYAQRHATGTFKTLDRLQGFFETLAGAPDRKAVLFVSDGLPLRPGEMLFQAWKAKFDFLTQGRWEQELHDVGLSPISGPEVEAARLYDAAVHETGNFNAAWAFSELGRRIGSQRITLYGLRPSETHRTNGSQEVGAESSRPHTQCAEHSAAASQDETSQRPLLRELAQNTGGFAFPEEMSFRQGLELLRRDLGTFYGLAFYPRPVKVKAKRQRIEVRTKNPQWTVRHRQSYGEARRQESMGERTLASLLHETVENPLGVTVDLSTVQFDERGQQRLPVLVKIPVQNLVLLPVEDHYEGRISIHVGARDPRGQMSPIESFQVDIHLPSHHLEADPGQSRLLAHQLLLQMSPGEHLLAIGVRDEVGYVEGTALINHRGEPAAVAVPVDP